ncbi:MAG TPA: spore germination protein, partial [Bacilli bacterium]
MPSKDAGHTYPISAKLSDNESACKELLGHSTDATFRRFSIAINENRGAIDCLLIFISSLSDEKMIAQAILEPLSSQFAPFRTLTANDVRQKIHSKNIREVSELQEAVLSVLRGNSLLLMNGCKTAFLINTQKSYHRSIDEPQSEIAVKGPRSGFVENLLINIALLRQRLPHPALQLEEVTIGTYSRTKTVIAYIKDIAQPEIVAKVKSRLLAIDIDSIDYSGQIEQFIEDHPSTIFPTIGNTQKPDKVSALLMEGRVAILTDGTPVALYVPHLFFEAIQSSEDYSSRPFYTSIIRMLRFIGLLLSVMAPSFYFAALNYHKEMIPTALVSPLINAREKVPI